MKSVCSSFPLAVSFTLALVVFCGAANPPAAVEKPPVVVDPLQPVVITQPDHVIGQGTPQSVTLEALDQAMQGGGTIVFNTGGKPVTIPVTKTLHIPQGARPVILDGGGLVTLDGLGKNQIILKDWKTELTVQRLKFINARTDKSGAAIHCEKWDGRLTVINCDFDNCKCTEDGPDQGGGAVRPLGQKHAQFSGCSFNDCAGSNGGAICSLGCQLTIINCSFTNCKAFGYGGGLDARPKAKGMGGIGGAIYIDGIDQNADEARLYVSGCMFRNNVAGDHAGGIFAYSRPDTTARNMTIFNACIFDNNKVSGEHDLSCGHAGAIYSQYSQLYILNSTFSNNSCPRCGAAVFISTERPVRVANCDLFNNTGSGEHGGIHGGSGEFQNVSTTLLPVSPAEAYLGRLPGPGPTTPKIFGKVKIDLCKKQADALAGDKSTLLPVLHDLDEMAKKDDARGQEAKELAQAARDWADAEVDRLSELAKTRPAAAYLEMDKLSARLARMPQEEKLNGLLKPLKADKNVKSLARLLPIVAAAKQPPSPKITKAAHAADIKKLKEMLADFQDTKDLSEALKEEAKDVSSGL